MRACCGSAHGCPPVPPILNHPALRASCSREKRRFSPPLREERAGRGPGGGALRPRDTPGLSSSDEKPSSAAASPSCPGCLLPIAIGWMICTRNLPRPTSRSLPLPKNRDPVPSPAAAWLPRISGILRIPSGPRPAVTTAATQLFQPPPGVFGGGASLGERRGRSLGPCYAHDQHGRGNEIRSTPAGAASWTRRPRARERADRRSPRRRPSGCPRACCRSRP